MMAKVQSARLLPAALALFAGLYGVSEVSRAEESAPTGTDKAAEPEIEPAVPPPPTLIAPPPGTAPTGATPGAPGSPGGPVGESTALERYQDCFQKMIDAGVTDNAYMKRCLGVEDRQPASSSAGVPPAFLRKPDVRRVVDEGLPGVRECYAKLLARTKDLGLLPEGVVEARFTVKPDGVADTLTFEPGALADVTLLTCIRDRIKAWRFPKTDADPDEQHPRVELALRLAVRSGRLPSVTVAKGSPKVQNPGAGLSPEDVLAVFRRHAPNLRECYDTLLKRQKTHSAHPSAGSGTPQGRVGVDVTVSPRGRVSKVYYREVAIGDAGFKKCVTAQLKSWRFPKPLGGEPFLVKFPPFVFKPKS